MDEGPKEETRMGGQGRAMKILGTGHVLTVYEGVQQV